MAKKTSFKDRILPFYTKGEEIFNMSSHIVGGGLGILVTVACVLVAAFKKNVMGIVTGAVFGATMILLYTVSSIYHGLTNKTAKKVFQVLDHCTIYFLIAGTYTPILLCSLVKVSPVAAYVTFGVVWGLTALATTLTAVDLKRFKVFGMLCYVGIGWSVIFSIREVYRALGAAGFTLLLAGGVMYTAGVVFYKVGKKKRYFHSIFHLFVLFGSILQALCVMFFVM